MGYSVGLCGLCIAGYTFYQQSLNNFEMTRRNDLEEVSLGFKTRESYDNRYNNKK